MAQPMISSRTHSRGFTLVELAVVLVIVGLLLGGLVMGMSAQIEIQRTSETRTTVERAREALIGFAAANGRLPCPATAGSNGAEDPATGGPCVGVANNATHGFVPGVTLGVTPNDAQGYVIDGWGNRLRYAVYSGTLGGQNHPFTTVNGMKTATMNTISSNDLLRVCNSASNITSSGSGGANCNPGTALTTKAPAIIYSTGKNSATTGGVGADEAANPNPNGNGGNDPTLVFHDPAPAGAPGGEFDDIITWLSLPVLFNRMIVAGRLP